MPIDLIEGIDPGLYYKIPNVHPAWCQCLRLAFFQCAVAHLEQAVAQLQAEAQRQDEEDMPHA